MQFCLILKNSTYFSGTLILFYKQTYYYLENEK